MNITATRSFSELIGIPDKTEALRNPAKQIQKVISQLPQYEPETNHYFAGGMYCREVKRCKDALIVGKVHKKEHFYVVASGTVAISQEGEKAKEVTGPAVIKSAPGTKRAVLALTDAVCMTFHRVDCETVAEAEAELVEEDPDAMFTIGNKVIDGALKFEVKKVIE